jgi:hypothetical protein
MMGSIVVWYASAITGGSADTMEEKNPNRDGEDWGVHFRHPWRADYLFREGGLSKAR